MALLSFHYSYHGCNNNSSIVLSCVWVGFNGRECIMRTNVKKICHFKVHIYRTRKAFQRENTSECARRKREKCHKNYCPGHSLDSRILTGDTKKLCYLQIALLLLTVALSDSARLTFLSRRESYVWRVFIWVATTTSITRSFTFLSVNSFSEFLSDTPAAAIAFSPPCVDVTRSRS